MQAPEIQSPRLSLNDLLFIFFKHKKKILLSTGIGLAAAAAFYFLFPPPYVSQAKLLVRYVLDTNAVDSIESQVKTPGGATYNENLLASEIEILTSWDLAAQVVASIPAEKLYQGCVDGIDKTKAAKALLQGLTVTALRGSNVLLVSYKNKDPELAIQILQDFVNRYFVKHLEVHRSAGAFEYVSNETEQVKSRLKNIDSELKSMKAKLGIISLTESTATLTVSLTKSEEALHAAEAEAAEQRARVKAMDGWHTTERPVNEETQKPDNDRATALNYQALSARLNRLEQSKQDLLTRFTSESRAVQLCQMQIENVEKERKDLETKYPELLNMTQVPLLTRDNQPDIHTEKARLAALDGKVETLKSQLNGYKEQTALLAEIGPQIAQLEHRKEVEELNYKYFQNSLEKARIDEALDPTKMPNISVVQKPSPALRDIKNEKKILIGLAAGGLIFGLGLALLIELEMDRSIKHPTELEIMRIPRMLSIPDFRCNGYARLRSKKGSSKSILVKSYQENHASWDDLHFIRPYCESLRDRLILHFQQNNMTRKPKLVAVTSCSKGAGASTLASGLASALSKTGDGKVLLVDMNGRLEKLHPFLDGTPFNSLAEAIQMGSQIPETSDNLYLAKDGSDRSGTTHLIPKKFYELIPNLKSCDFDYIIFDMPPLNQSSTTLAMAGFMDKVLLVVEAEVSQRDAIQWGYGELIAANANVSTVFNKNRNYGPTWIHNKV